MPSITLETFDHVVFLVLLALLPWNGRRRFLSLVAGVDAGDPNARTRSYRTVVAQKWALTGVIAVAWIALSRTASSIGLAASVTPLAIVGYALTALAIGALLLSTRTVARSDELRNKTRKAIAPVRALLPHTATEKRWFDAVSVTAGICEEFVYRGFLFAYLAAVLPEVPAAVIVVLAGVVFGLGHLYQGVPGIVKTGALGVLFGALYWMTGSVWAPMLLHIAIDLTSGWINYQVLQEGGLDDRAGSAAA